MQFGSLFGTKSACFDSERSGMQTQIHADAGIYISECKTQNSEYVPSIQLTKEEQTSPDHKEALQTGSPISSHGSPTQSTSRAFPQHVGRQTLSGSPNLSNIRPPSIKASSVDLKVLCQFHL